MKISPVNTISFGKLIIQNADRTAKSIATVVQNANSFGVVKDTFEKIDKKTGDEPAYLTAITSPAVSENDVTRVNILMTDRIGDVIKDTTIRQDEGESLINKAISGLQDLSNFRVWQESAESLVANYKDND